MPTMSNEDIELPDEEKILQERREFPTELATQEPILFEEESMTLHSALFDKISKIFIFEKTNARNKKDQGNTSSMLC
jgi:hypothetical protein